MEAKEKNYIQNKGITLVALVITIVILLILAGISISSLTNTGIFEKAKDAKKASENAELEQNKVLDEYEKELDKYGDNTLVSKFNSGKIKVGDYVSYTPDQANTNEILEELKTYSGSDANSSSKLKQEMDLKWRVLDVKDGKLRLISDKATTSLITLSGSNGYNNAVYLLDKTCKTLYNNSKLTSNVQNLKIEDIQDHLTYDYTQYRTSDTDLKYGETKEYTTNKNYPYIFKNEKTGWVDGVQGTEYNLSEQVEMIDETKIEARKSIKTIQTYWYKSTKPTDFENEKYYNLFVDNGINYNPYWMSSRCTNARSGRIDFCVYRVGTKVVSADYLYVSYEYEHPVAYAIRPIIVLKSNAKLNTENSENGSIESPFYIK